MHVLLIHQAFVSGQEAGGTRHYEFGKYLVQRGHQFTVVTSDRSYLSGEIKHADTNSHSTKMEDGICVRLVHVRQNLHRNYLSRFLAFISFMVSSTLIALRTEGVDVIYGTSPPIFQGISAYFVSRLKRKPLVFEVRDLWPDFPIHMGVLRNPALIKMSRWLEKFLYRHADHLIVNSPGFLPYITRHGIPENKIVLIPNGVDADMFNPVNNGKSIRRKLGAKERFIVLYAGAHGPANDLDTLVEAANLLRDEPKILFVCVGDGKDRPRLMQRAKELKLDNLRFVPAQPKEEMPDYLAASDVCIALLKNIPMFDTTYPNKVFDYMAAGRPTILAIDGVIRKVIEDANGGEFVPPGDAAALAHTVRHYYLKPSLCKKQGDAARAYVVAHFSRKTQSGVLERLLSDVIVNTR